ncbi:hypothetical protein [Variovorax sp. PCZ-1]|uniref:hypothetical protein n=1 Tax=Variovorax sp. PCZ-1 TaxID=2835533 RepID=UPI001BCBBC41|nr:hypothetical protein [Variovorax sp. PCZ-1]MBS7807638.1 hypothetical protein [Variovorax sp. PCZ-1]
MKSMRIQTNTSHRKRIAKRFAYQAGALMLTTLAAQLAYADLVSNPTSGRYIPPSINIVGPGTGPPISNIPPRGAGPSLEISSPTLPSNPGRGSTGGVTPGTGPVTVPTPPATPAIPPAAALPLQPPAPAPGAAPTVTSQPPLVTTPSATVSQPATIITPTPTLPVSGAIDITPSRPVTTVDGQVQPGAGPITNVSLAEPPGTSTPPRGTGLLESTLPKTPPQGNSFTGNAPAPATLREIIPETQVLLSSMRVIQPSIPNADNRPPTQVQARSQTACIPVTLRPDAQRTNTTLVDLTGDGLIVSAVPNAHVQAVFTRAGYAEVNLTQAVRWCIAQAASRELVQLQGNLANQADMRLVQVSQGWQLMSHEQWVSHQATLVSKAQDSSSPRLLAASNSNPRKAAGLKTTKLRPNRPSSVTVLVQQLGNSLDRGLGRASKQVVAQAAKP